MAFTRRRHGKGRGRSLKGGAGLAATTVPSHQVGGGASKLPPPGPAQCHPSVKREGHGCLPLAILQKVAKAKHISPSLKGPALRKRIAEALGLQETVGEATFLSALPLAPQEKADLARTRLRPRQPQEWIEDPDKWLDSNNIADVLNQYEEAYPEFEFMGPFPIDFAAPDPYEGGAGSFGAGGGVKDKRCLMNEICELRVKKALENGTKAVGIVYNLDPHFKGGSHWVANYIDIVGHKCYYFDSYGMKPPPQVAKFMRWLTTQDPKMQLAYSARRLQYKNTECGVYSSYFIIMMLLGDTFTAFSRRKPTDADMLDLRDWLFST